MQKITIKAFLKTSAKFYKINEIFNKQNITLRRIGCENNPVQSYRNLRYKPVDNIF